MKLSTLSLFCFLVFIKCSSPLKILSVFSSPVKSNSILGESLVRHLVKAGHEVTYITAFPPKQPDSNVTVVDVSFTREVLKEDDGFDLRNVLESPHQEDLKSLLLRMIEVSNLTVANPNVIKLLNERRKHFDLVIVEWLFSEIYGGFAALYECPLIWFSAMEPHWMILKIVDGLPNPAYSPDLLSECVPPFSIRQRALELWHQIWGIILHTVYFWRAEFDVYEKLFTPFFRNRGRELTEYRDLIYNASLVLSNSHVALGMSMTLPQNFIPVGGFHIDKNLETMSEDLRSLLDNNTHGVIYFSMGATLKSKNLPEQIILDLLLVFGNLKETVIWKYEGELPNKPANVHTVDWAPQQSILAHESCVLFITSGGLLSVLEAIHYRVPLVGLPVTGEQRINIHRAVLKGFAQKVSWSNNFAEDLDKAVWDVRTAYGFQRKIREASLIYHDRPVPAGEELVHWVEHVAKTRGALHLRSPALLLTWNHRYYLDVAFIFCCLCFMLYDVFIRRFITMFVRKEKED